MPSVPMHRWSVGAAVLVAAGLATWSHAQAQVLERGADGVTRQVGGGWEIQPAASVQGARPAGIPAAYRAAVLAAAERYDLSPELIDAVARTESRYDPDIVSPAGAIGIMQLMPDTARSLGVDPWNPTQNIIGGAAYLRAQLDRFDGDLDKALAAYNAGPGRVIQYSGVPPFKETRAYVATNLDRLASQMPTTLVPASLTISTDPEGDLQ